MGAGEVLLLQLFNLTLQCCKRKLHFLVQLVDAVDFACLAKMGFIVFVVVLILLTAFIQCLAVAIR